MWEFRLSCPASHQGNSSLSDKSTPLKWCWLFQKTHKGGGRFLFFYSIVWRFIHVLHLIPFGFLNLNSRSNFNQTTQCPLLLDNEPARIIFIQNTSKAQILNKQKNFWIISKLSYNFPYHCYFGWEGKYQWIPYKFQVDEQDRQERRNTKLKRLIEATKTSYLKLQTSIIITKFQSTKIRGQANISTTEK